MAGGITSSLATLAGTPAAGGKGQKSNLKKVSEDVSKMLGVRDKPSRKRKVDDKDGKKKGKRR